MSDDNEKLRARRQASLSNDELLAQYVAAAAGAQQTCFACEALGLFEEAEKSRKQMHRLNRGIARVRKKLEEEAKDQWSGRAWS